MTDQAAILATRRDGVVTITLNRPARKNAIETPMWTELLELLKEISRRPDDRAVVITGAGDSFCSGAAFGPAEIEAYRQGHMLEIMHLVGDVALALHRLPKPTIARVNGAAVGAGANLALACDIIVASDTAVFYEIFVRLGLAVDFGGTWLLPRLVGLHRAKELALLGDKISAQHAADIGLVNRVVPSAELDAVVDNWARRLADGPPLALALTKRMLNDSFGLSLDEALEGEARSQHITFSSRDLTEGLAAFADRRAPRFQGR